MTQPRAGQVLAANLKALRERSGLSLSELARRSGIAKGTLSQLESGAGNPTIETVFSLSNALSVPVSSLLTLRSDPDVVLIRSADLEVLSSNAVDLRMLRRLDVTETVFEMYDQRVRPGQQQHSDGHAGIEHVTVVAGR
ncbi:MAG TPA: helix-turn-helix domain-containing protein, partial [Kutzneria sp.]|nr:helix-turn-helix domain-containing protein [Kutzneria sp.]